MRKKGQLLSQDVMFSFISFGVVVILAIWFFAYASSHQSEKEVEETLQITGLSAFATLFESPGSPSYWQEYDIVSESENIDSIGMGAGDGVLLSIAKLTAINGTELANYKNVKRLIGLSKASYDYYYTIQPYNTNGTLSDTVLYESGKEVDSSSDIAKKYTAVKVIGDTQVHISFWVFTKS